MISPAFTKAKPERFSRVGRVGSICFAITPLPTESLRLRASSATDPCGQALSSRPAPAVELSWMPALQKDTRTRNGHASTAIEGNPLTFEQVRALEEGRELSAVDARPKREVLNYFAGLRYVEKHARKKAIRHEDVLELHRLFASQVKDQGEAGRYRMVQVRVGRHVPPAAADVSGLMFELLEWWNLRAAELSPVLSRNDSIGREVMAKQMLAQAEE